LALTLWRAKSPPRDANRRGRAWSFDWPTSIAGAVLILLLLGLHAWNPLLVEAARLKVFDQYKTT
jgi:hypothetical protein